MKIPKIDLSKAWVTWVCIGFGIQLFVLLYPDYQQPLGFVWGTRHGGKKKRFEVIGSFTEIYFRRMGVRSKINEEILKQNDLITSPHATQQGRRFMLANGYKFSKELSQWYKTKETK